MNHWREESSGLRSRGSLAKRPGSLAGLHEARRTHQGQFFTPRPLAEWLWRMVEPAMRRAQEEGGQSRRVSVIDTSCGAGALLQFADPRHHILAGMDVDMDAVNALGRDAEEAGFDCTFVRAGMEECHPKGYSVALINPPFSIHLESPHLIAGRSTAYGRFGPDTSAFSHAYAVEQALRAAHVVGAILPRGYALTLLAQADEWPRLLGVFHAPRGSFAEEGTPVDVSVLLFSRKARKPGVAVLVETIDSQLAHTPDIGLECASRALDVRTVGQLFVNDDVPSITRAVTGDRRVRVGHSGRKLTLGFRCGFTEAKVRNAILVARLPPSESKEHRYPKGVSYIGEGALDLEVHLAQEHPVSSVLSLVEHIRQAGGEPDVDPGLLRYLEKQCRRSRIASTPFRHTVRVPAGFRADNGPLMAGVARRTHTADPTVWGSAVIAAGKTVEFSLEENGEYHYTAAGRNYRISKDELFQRFDTTAAGSEERWETVHAGRLAAFPEDALALRKRAQALGLDQFLWDYQLDDLLELAMGRSGSAAWAVGLGKARLGVALVLLSGCKHGLIATEAYLIDEMRTELGKLPVKCDDWQVISGPADLNQLRRINIISYNRLRSPVCREHSRRTYAARLRHRVGILVADEGDLLRNKDTAQTAALWQIGARRRYILSGTPFGNMPRDAFALLGFTGGDATASQPYGLRRWYLEPRLVASTQGCVRGIDRVRDQFLTLEWVTNEFADELSHGAKREIPRLRNLDAYREAIAPHIKRRVAAEPDVAKHFSIPAPERVTTTVGWDNEHLAYYLQLAEEFRDWYRNQNKDMRGNNLVALLARIKAVQIAAAVPQRPMENSAFRYFGGLTSKQRLAVERLVSLSREGHKTIAYAEWPDMLEIVGRELTQRGIPHVILHGKIPIRERVRLLNQFRFGNTPVLLPSLGVAQKGLNIEQADRVLFMTRSWTAKTEEQAEGRVLRPQQTRNVVSEFLELEGSIDQYQRQAVENKRDSIGAGLDWGTPQLEDVEFLHLDTILGRFVEDLANVLGCERHKVRERLAA